VTENEYSESKNNKTHPTKRLGLYLMIPLLVGFIVLYLLAGEWQTSLRVDRIEIDGAHILPHHLLLAAVKVPTQSLLDTVDLYLIQKRLEKQPFIRTVSVSRLYPDALRIELTERQPIASIGSSRLQYIDTAAVLLPAIETAVTLDLPLITGISGLENAEEGTTLTNSEVRTAIDLLQTALKVDSSLYRFISEVDMNNGQDIELTTTEPPILIIIGREDFPKKLLIFQTFWGQFVKSNDVQNVQYFDLRFDDQVVVKWISENNNQ
jgi:cell division septal protein FtsQ